MNLCDSMKRPLYFESELLADLQKVNVNAFTPSMTVVK